MRLTLLNADDPSQVFPPVNNALTKPDGLLAIGGCLQPERLLTAYRQGIFPWFNPGEPLLWWSPNPRWVLTPETLHITRSLAKCLRKNAFTLTVDTAFGAVMQQCAAPRKTAQGTWIGDEMFTAYNRLHQLGYAHSIEAWQAGHLVGGLYGVAIGQVFFGESMFHRVNNASKVILVQLMHLLQEWHYRLLDCQVHSVHLERLGAKPMPRTQFVALLADYTRQFPRPDAWQNA